MKLIHINLNHSKAEQDLLKQTIYNEKRGVDMICEQYKNTGHELWVEYVMEKVTVWVY